MVRQFWIYMLEEDEPELFAAIEAAKPGSIVAGGRFVRGEATELLARKLDALRFEQLSSREVHRLIFHEQASKQLVANVVEEGPLAKTQSIDASRSDCLHLVRPKPVRGLLEPSRLFGETHVTRGETKLRKPPEYFLWLSAVHKKLKAAFPRSGVDFIHVAPRARAWAQSGEGTLTYLFQPVPLEPRPAPTPITTPQKRQR